MGLQGLWVLALAAAHVQGASIPQCCKEKSVGGVEYVLVEETDTVRFGCKSNCVFERVDNPGSRFCFKAGDLEVVCEGTEDGTGGSGTGGPPIETAPGPGGPPIETAPAPEPNPELERSICSYSSQHTLNLYPEEAGTCGAELIFSGLDPWAKELLLDKHNQMRQRVASGAEPGQPGAADMMKLVWSEELEISAQRWADQCQAERDEMRDLCDGTPVGQNIYVGSSDTDEPIETVKEAVSAAVDAWYDQVTMPGFIPEDINPYMYIEGTEEYSQLVWAETTQIGCGMVYFQTESGSYSQVVVCNYAGAGNTAGSSLYTPGTPCTACPATCDTTYPALCARQ